MINLMFRSLKSYENINNMRIFILNVAKKLFCNLINLNLIKTIFFSLYN